MQKKKENNYVLLAKLAKHVKSVSKWQNIPVDSLSDFNHISSYLRDYPKTEFYIL